MEVFENSTALLRQKYRLDLDTQWPRYKYDEDCATPSENSDSDYSAATDVTLCSEDEREARRDVKRWKSVHTAVTVAAWNNQPDVLRILLAAGATVPQTSLHRLSSITTSETTSTNWLLIDAVQDGFPEIVKELLEVGLPIRDDFFSEVGLTIEDLIRPTDNEVTWFLEESKRVEMASLLLKHMKVKIIYDESYKRCNTLLMIFLRLFAQVAPSCGNSDVIKRLSYSSRQ